MVANGSPEKLKAANLLEAKLVSGRGISEVEWNRRSILLKHCSVKRNGENQTGHLNAYTGGISSRTWILWRSHGPATVPGPPA